MRGSRLPEEPRAPAICPPCIFEDPLPSQELLDSCPIHIALQLCCPTSLRMLPNTSGCAVPLLCLCVCSCPTTSARMHVKVITKLQIRPASAAVRINLCQRSGQRSAVLPQSPHESGVCMQQVQPFAPGSSATGQPTPYPLPHLLAGLWFQQCFPRVIGATASIAATTGATRNGCVLLGSPPPPTPGDDGFLLLHTPPERETATGRKTVPLTWPQPQPILTCSATCVAGGVAHLISAGACANPALLFHCSRLQGGMCRSI